MNLASSLQTHHSPQMRLHRDIGGWWAKQRICSSTDTGQWRHWQAEEEMEDFRLHLEDECREWGSPVSAWTSSQASLHFWAKYWSHLQLLCCILYIKSLKSATVYDFLKGSMASAHPVNIRPSVANTSSQVRYDVTELCRLCLSWSESKESFCGRVTKCSLWKIRLDHKTPAFRHLFSSFENQPSNKEACKQHKVTYEEQLPHLGSNQ